MAKPIDIISRALKDIGALEAGEVPTAKPEMQGGFLAAASLTKDLK